MLKIHHMPRARGLRVVWLCEEMGLPYEIAPVSFPPGEDYLKLNPMGAIPFLEDDGGVAINESIAMLLYIAQKYGPTPLLPGPHDPAFARTLQMTVFGETTLGMWGNVQMAARLFAPEEEKDNWSRRDARARMRRGFDYAAGMLERGPYMAGGAFTLADISVGYAIGVGLSPFFQMKDEIAPSLLAYHDRLIARPAYERAVAVK